MREFVLGVEVMSIFRRCWCRSDGVEEMWGQFSYLAFVADVGRCEESYFKVKLGDESFGCGIKWAGGVFSP